MIQMRNRVRIVIEKNKRKKNKSEKVGSNNNAITDENYNINKEKDIVGGSSTQHGIKRKRDTGKEKVDESREDMGIMFSSDEEPSGSLGENIKRHEHQTHISSEEMIVEYADVPRPDKRLYLVKLPNILGMECKPFSASTYNGEEEDEEYEGEINMKRLNPETIVRWRKAYDKDGNEIKESNARIVKWSNGTQQLFIAGNTEILDVVTKPISNDHLHLFQTQKGIIQCNGKLESKLFFSPSSIHSKSHQKLTLAIAGQAKQKLRKVKLVGSIPVEDVRQAIKDKEKSAQKLEAMQKKKLSKLGIEEDEQNYGTSDSEGEEGGRQRRERKRGDVDEKRILDAKSSESPVRRERKKEEEQQMMMTF